MYLGIRGPACLFLWGSFCVRVPPPSPQTLPDFDSGALLRALDGEGVIGVFVAAASAASRPAAIEQPAVVMRTAALLNLEACRVHKHPVAWHRRARGQVLLVISFHSSECGLDAPEGHHGCLAVLQLVLLGLPEKTPCCAVVLFVFRRSRVILRMMMMVVTMTWKMMVSRSRSRMVMINGVILMMTLRRRRMRLMMMWRKRKMLLMRLLLLKVLMMTMLVVATEMDR